MLTRGDIADALYERLFRGKSGEAPARAAGKAPPAKKIFLSDWELRRMMKPGQKKLVVPRNAIVSPLAMDWLDYNGVEITRE